MEANGLIGSTRLCSCSSRLCSSPSLPLVGAAIGRAFLATFAMGVDFPNCNRRYSRLAEAG